MSAEDPINTTAEALKLLNTLVSLLSVTQKKHPSLAASLVVKKLPDEALRSARDLAAVLRDCRADLEAAGVDLKRTLDDLQGDYDWWHFSRYRAVRNCRRRLAGIRGSFAELLDDMIAVALCSRAEELLVQSHKDALAKEKEIHAMTGPDRPLRDVLDDTDALLATIIIQLGDL